MSKTGRWIIAVLLLLSVGVAGRALTRALRGAPVSKIERAFEPPAGVRLPPVSTRIALVVAAPPAPPPQPPPPAATPRPRPAATRPAVVAAAVDAAPRGPQIALERTLPPLPPPEDEPADLTFADRRIEAEYAAADYDDALGLALSTCKGGDAFACALAGNMQTRGEGNAKKSPVPEQGPDLLVKSCKMGDTWGCTRVEALRGR